MPGCVHIRAEHVEPLIMGVIAGRLANPTPSICLRADSTTRPSRGAAGEARHSGAGWTKSRTNAQMDC